MSKPLFIKNTIDINATAAKVWDALVNPKQTKKYMFGCETVSDWNVGDSLLWQGNHDGKDIVYVKGEILAIGAGRHLAYTTIDPHSNIDDNADNYLTVTYDLKESNGITTFTVTQGDYSKVAEGERRYKDSYNNGEGWNPILKAIKELVEGGN